MTYQDLEGSGSSEKETPRERSIVDGEVATDGGMDFAEMRRRGLYFSCSERGHLARNCPGNVPLKVGY